MSHLLPMPCSELPHKFNDAALYKLDQAGEGLLLNRRIVAIHGLT